MTPRTLDRYRFLNFCWAISPLKRKTEVISGFCFSTYASIQPIDGAGGIMFFGLAVRLCVRAEASRPVCHRLLVSSLFFVLIRMCTKLEKRWQCVISKPLGTFNIASHHITYFNIKHVLLTYIRPQVPATADSIRVYDLRHRLRQISAYNIQRNGSLLHRRTCLVHIHSLRFNYT